MDSSENIKGLQLGNVGRAEGVPAAGLVRNEVDLSASVTGVAGSNGRGFVGLLVPLRTGSSKESSAGWLAEDALKGERADNSCVVS